MIVLDTHALLWWALDPEKLSTQARTIAHQMEDQGGFASAISIWHTSTSGALGELAGGSRRVPDSSGQLRRSLPSA